MKAQPHQLKNLQVIGIFGPSDEKIWDKILTTHFPQMTENPREDGDKVPMLITSHKKLESFEFLSKQRYFLVISVALNWPGEHTGYSVALELIQRYTLPHPPHLVFVSFEAQSTLVKASTGFHRYIARAFQHILLPEINFSWKESQFSEGRWNYFRGYLLTAPGIADAILHDIRRIDHSSPHTRNAQLQQIYAALPKISPLFHDLPDDWRDFPDPDQDLDAFYAKLPRLQVMIEARLSEIRTSNLESEAETDTAEKFTIALLEDDPAQGERMAQILSPYFEVQTFQTGQTCLDAIANHPYGFRAIFIDLELLDDEGCLEQPLQGLDVCAWVQEKYPHMAIRIITNLGRQALRVMLPDLRMDQYIYKQQLNGWSVMDCLRGLHQDILKLAKWMNLPGPNNSVWGLSQVPGQAANLKALNYDLLNHSPEKFRQMWERIVDCVKAYIDGNGEKYHKEAWFFKNGQEAANISKMLPQKKLEYLEYILTHRLMLLSHFNDGAPISYPGDLNDTKRWKHLPFPRYPKRYFIYLGLGLEDYDDDELELDRIRRKEKDKKQGKNQDENPVDCTFTFKPGELLRDEDQAISRVKRHIEELVHQHILKDLAITVNRMLDQLHDYNANNQNQSSPFLSLELPTRVSDGEYPDMEVCEGFLKQLAAIKHQVKFLPIWEDLIQPLKKLYFADIAAFQTLPDAIQAHARALY